MKHTTTASTCRPIARLSASTRNHAAASTPLRFRLRRGTGFILLASAALFVWTQVATPGYADWLPTTGTNVWQTTTNWSGETIDGKFNQVSAGDQFVTLTGSTSIASLQFLYDGAFNMTLQSSTTTSRTLSITGGVSMDSVQDGRTVQIGATSAGVLLNLGGLVQDFTVAGTDTLVLFNSISNTADGGINKKGTGTLRLEGTSSAFTLGTTLTDGTIAVGANAALGAGTVTLNGGRIAASGATRTLANNFVIGGDVTFGGLANSMVVNGTVDLGSALRTITAENSLTFGNSISGTGGVAFTTGATARTITLSAANGYTGGTSIGGLATLALSGAGTIADANAVTLSTSTAVLSISAITAASETIGSLAGVASSSVVLGSKNLTFGADDTAANFAGIISGTSGAGSVTKIGAGVQTFSGGNTYVGTTSIQGGTLRLTGAGTLGVAPAAATPGNVIINGGATFFVDQLATSSFNSNRGFAIGPTTGTGSATIQVADDPATDIDATINGIITDNGGSGRLVKTGAGKLRLLTSVNTFTGGISILEGTLVFANDTRLGAVPASPTPGSILINSGTLQLQTLDVTLSTNRGIAIGPASGSGSGTISVDAGLTLTSGAVIANNGAGAGRLIKTGAGTLRLQTSPNTFTGGVSILAGTLRIALDSRLGATPGVATPGSLLISTGASLTFDPTSPLTINANRGIALGPDTGSGSGTIDVSPADLANTVTYGGIIANNGAGSGGLIKAGPGTLKLSGASTYTGPTQVNTGNLEVSGSLSGTTNVAASTGGTLLLSGVGGTDNKLSTSATATLGGGKLDLGGITSSSLDQQVGALTLSSSSVLDFGTLAAGNTFRFADSTGVAWTSGQTLSIWNWTAGADHLFFGNTFGGGVTAGQLGQISFYAGAGTGFVGLAAYDTGGQLSAIPEPSTTGLLGVAGLVGLIGFREFRRRPRAPISA